MSGIAWYGGGDGESKRLNYPRTKFELEYAKKLLDAST